MKYPRAAEQIPSHLLPYVAKQDARNYTPIDHASWRYIMRVSKSYFKKHAHEKYLEGLKATGIPTDRIPMISKMDEVMRQFGWRSVPVVGFIPPAVFMEFLASGILPIACDMRTLEHLAYTPAPDIVHEAAGHAPIIADPEYANYLRHYGELARKAIFSKSDMETYLAIRKLSDLKEDPHCDPKEVKKAEEQLAAQVASSEYVSEATFLSRMGWWTIEYGLIGTMHDLKIYGAGLLSSVKESYHCLSDKVKKVPFSLDCIHVAYDITRPQPQLFVTPDFQTLIDALKQLGKSMAYQQGGLSALAKAKMAESVTTTVFNTELGISGKLEEVFTDDRGIPFFLKYSGPTQLSYQGVEIEKQGAREHSQGFSTPLGALKFPKTIPSKLTESDLKSGKLVFDSGVELRGTPKQFLRKNGKTLLIRFEKCTITYGSKILYDPSWGSFDLACGEEVVSVYGNAADIPKYTEATESAIQPPGNPKTNLTSTNQELNRLYSQVREIRISKEYGPKSLAILDKIYSTLLQKYSRDWLLRLELLELVLKNQLDTSWKASVENELKALSDSSQELAELITRGLKLLERYKRKRNAA